MTTAHTACVFEREKALHDIFGVAQSMTEFVTAELARRGVSVQSLSTTQPFTSIPPLNLPFPRDILSWLESTSLPPLHLAQSIVKLHETIAKLQRSHTRCYEETCQKLLASKRPAGKPTSTLVDNLRQTFEALYTQRRLPLLKSQLIAAYDAHQKLLQGKNIDRKKVQFNHEFTPLLDKYFEYNAYPSLADRKQLATTCKMTVRQIEVWFQNHRSRAKKDGQYLRRLQNHPLPVEISLESLREKMPLFFNPEHETQAERDVEGEDSSDEEPVVCSVNIPSTPIDILDVSAPAHAFPAMRGQDFGYQPFPKDQDGKSNMRFPPPVWARKPATTPINTSSIDFDDFLESFAEKCNLRKPSKKRPERQGKSDVELIRSGMVCWFACRITVPFVAPHPALVRQTTTVRISPIQSRPASRSRSRSLTPATSTPAPKSNMSQRRRVAGLPKRTPRHASVAHGSDGSATAYSRSPSRTPSTTSRSLSSTSARSMSSSSSSSSLSTPPSSPSSLPHTAQLSTFDDDDDLHSLDMMNRIFPGGFTIPEPDSLVPGGYSRYSPGKGDPGMQGFNSYLGSSMASFVQVRS